MKKILFKTLLLAALALAGLLPLTAQAKEKKDDGTAKNLTNKCSYSHTGRKNQQKNASDNRIKSYAVIPAKDGKPASLTVTWKDKVEVAGFFLQWTQDAPDYTAEWYTGSGSLISKEEYSASRRLDQWLTVPGGARKLVISSEHDMEISECTAYGPGELPETVNLPADTPEKLDYLVISTHPDDDQLFLGAVVPVYGAERGYTGTVLFMTCRERNRYEEALNGQRVSGLNNLPLFAFKKDGGPDYREVRKFWDFDETVAMLVSYLREFKPEVVMTHDLKGEYGHALHRITSEAVVEAVTAAADPSVDPESYEKFGAWQVKKLYIHLYPENKLTIDMQQPLEAFGGKTALEVATAAYKEHKSQQYLWFYVSDTGIYSAAEYGLAYSTVGLDTPGLNDMFEHIGTAAEAETDTETETVLPEEPLPEEEGTREAAPLEEAVAEDTEPAVLEGVGFTAKADFYGTVHFRSETAFEYVYLSKIATPPATDSDDWVAADAGGKTAAVWKSDGTYNAFTMNAQKETAGPYPVTVDTGSTYPEGGTGLKAADRPIGEMLAERGTSLEKVNERIAEAAVSAGLYSRAAVAASAATAVRALAEAGLAVPYRSAGRYDDGEVFGIDEKWGSALPKTESDNNGRYYVYGLHCHASTVFAFKQAGLNLTSTGGQDEVHHYGRKGRTNDNAFNRRHAHAGDVLKTETTHTMMVVERRDTDNDGEDDAFLVLEMVSPMMILRVAPFRRSYDGFSMQNVFDDTGALKKKAAFWPDTFRIPEEALPEAYQKALRRQAAGGEKTE